MSRPTSCDDIGRPALRILLVNVYTKVTGGADRHCLDLAAILRRRGHEVRFLAAGDPATEAGAFVPLTVTSANRSTLSGRAQLTVLQRGLWNATAAAAMGRLLQEFKPNVVHAHKLYPQLSVAPIVCAHEARVPVVQTVHDFEFVSASAEDAQGGRIDRREATLRFGALNTATLPIRKFIHARRVTEWIAVSHFVAGVYADRGIDCNVLENFTLPGNEGSLPFVQRHGAVFIGRLVEHKGVADVLELARRKPDLSVTIAGSGVKANEVRDAANSLPNLHYAGELDANQAKALLGGARVVLMPSRWAEPGPLIALEAMALGTPIVAFANGGLAEYIENAAAGITTEEDPAALAQTTDHLHSDRQRWDRFSRAGIAAIENIHSPHRYVERLEPIYRAAIRRGAQ